jgi:hypothetical protein
MHPPSQTHRSILLVTIGLCLSAPVAQAQPMTPPPLVGGQSPTLAGVQFESPRGISPAPQCQDLSESCPGLGTLSEANGTLANQSTDRLTTVGGAAAHSHQRFGFQSSCLPSSGGTQSTCSGPRQLGHARATFAGLTEQTASDGHHTRALEVSAGVAGISTSCYERHSGGPTCRGSIVGSISTNCGLPAGCQLDYLGLVVSIAGNLNDRWAVAGQLGIAGAMDVGRDRCTDVVAGPRLKAWHVFGQVLVGAEAHEILPAELVIQPGVGIDLWRMRYEVEYSYVPGYRPLSGPRVMVRAVWHVTF